MRHDDVVLDGLRGALHHVRGRGATSGGRIKIGGRFVLVATAAYCGCHQIVSYWQPMMGVERKWGGGQHGRHALWPRRFDDLGHVKGKNSIYRDRMVTSPAQILDFVETRLSSYK